MDADWWSPGIGTGGIGTGGGVWRGVSLCMYIELDLQLSALVCVSHCESLHNIGKQPPGYSSASSS
jgi:hypothetical protein